MVFSQTIQIALSLVAFVFHLNFQASSASKLHLMQLVHGNLCISKCLYGCSSSI